jgi:hypothetical protein
MLDLMSYVAEAIRWRVSRDTLLLPLKMLGGEIC